MSSMSAVTYEHDTDPESRHSRLDAWAETSRGRVTLIQPALMCRL
jgi:hypothetical protein